jgi:hypothetical protein
LTDEPEKFQSAAAVSLKLRTKGVRQTKMEDKTPFPKYLGLAQNDSKNGFRQNLAGNKIKGKTQNISSAKAGHLAIAA